jgi:glutamine amidotransferase
VTTRTAVLIPTGVANLASIAAAMHRADVATRIAVDPQDILTADIAVLPGVGSFDAGRDALAQRGFDEALCQRIGRDQATLAICLGFQLLLEGSDESRRDLPGLGIFAGRAQRIGDEVRVPHLGWNTVRAMPEARYLTDGAAAFAHSFCLRSAPASGHAAWTDYDAPFVAAVERGNLLACQFHPELSGSWGRGLLERFCAQSLGGDA